MFAEIHAKTAALNEQIAKLRKEAADLVKPMLQEFIKSHPTIKQVAWTQYTPHFNDGDACVFGINDPGFYFEGDDLDGHPCEFELPYKYDSEYAGDFRAKCDAATYEACKSLRKELMALESPLESLFGDHVKVTVNAAGVSVDEYDHD